MTPPNKYGDPNFKPYHVKDLREYLSILAQHGDMIEVREEVDWNLEIGAIIRRVNETGAPAPLFTNIKDYEPGFRVLGSPAVPSALKGRELLRLAVSTGLPVHASGTDIVEALSHVQELEPIEPTIVERADFQKNVLTGDDIDLFALPVPLIHDGDGNRFINTFGTIIAPHPDGKWTNWAIARIALRDKNTMMGLFQPMQHLGQIYRVWKAKGQPMPFALSLGQEPVIPFFSGMPLPDHVSEAGAIGAYLKEPLELVKAHTVDLFVPASSEIVIEGFVSIEESEMEGPMSEYPGYLIPGARSAKPIYHVTAISYRDDAILPVVSAGFPPEEDHTVWGVAASAVVLGHLRKNGFPVTSVFQPFMSAIHLMVITVPQNWRSLSEIQNREEFARTIGKRALSVKGGDSATRVLVVEDDVDPSSSGEVLWALMTRVHPRDDVYDGGDQVAIPLIVYLNGNEKASFLAEKSILNGLHRDEWSDLTRPLKADFTHNFSHQLQRQVLDKWTTYGFPPNEK